MSHAAYFFLVDLDLSFDEGSALDQAIDSLQSYAANFCDENNYWEVLGVVTNDNQIFGSFSHTGPGNAWDVIWDQAARAVASEFAGEIDPEFTLQDKSRQEIIAWCNDKMPSHLARMYQDAAGNHPANGFCIDRYARASLSRAYELYQRTFDCDRVPFTCHLAEPYDYYAFDLTGGEQPNAIIVVDIHT